jgi:4'-phosphopantetheinyl transferase
MTSASSGWETPPVNPTLSSPEVHVWRASLHTEATQLAQFYATLADDERGRAGRFYRQQDRVHYITARGILRALLGHYLHLSPQQVCLAYNAYGKPELASDSGPQPLRFNLSHSHELVLYGFTHGREIGIDIEYIRPTFARDQIAKQFFSPRENAALRVLTDSQHTLGFFNCWTRKEAYIKARGQGLSLALDQFDVSLTPGEPAALLQTRDIPQEAARWSLHELAPGPGYLAAVAVEGRDWRLMTWQWPGSYKAGSPYDLGVSGRGPL